MRFTINADGGARGNPGPAGAGAIVRDETGKTIVAVSRFLGHQTNNFAEYSAVIFALEELEALLGGERAREAEVIVRLDSELVVKQMNKEYKVKHPVLKEKHAELTRATAPFRSVSFAHVRREENKDADALANRAMDDGV